jgi:hypothetical protein
MVNSDQSAAVGSTRATEVVREFDWHQVQPTTAIVETIAAATARDELDLEPLGQQVPTDAIEGLFRPGRHAESDRVLEVTVNYSGYRVTVKGDGTVHARRVQSASD